MKAPKSVLALSTLGGQSSVALTANHKRWRAISDNEKHVHALTALLESVQQQSGCAWQELDVIVCDIGPASLTGVRVGLSTVQGIALPYATPVWPCLHHAIQAYHYLMQMPAEQKEDCSQEIWVAEDARMHALSWAVYKSNPKGGLVCKQKPQLISPEALHDKLVSQERLPIFLGAGWQRYQEAWQGYAMHLPPEEAYAQVSLAEAMVALALATAHKNPLETVSAQTLQACYLRPPV